MTKCDDYLDVFLQPGDFYFGDAATRIRTILGSCVAITMWHAVRCVGGMCHYLLPSRQSRGGHDLDGRYGEEAIQLFLKEIGALGTFPSEYQVKVFGGGNMFPAISTGKGMEVGLRNIAMAIDLLEHHGFSVAAKHVGDVGHRNIIFDVWSGDVWVRHQKTAARPEPAGTQ